MPGFDFLIAVFNYISLGAVFCFRQSIFSHSSVHRQSGPVKLQRHHEMPCVSTGLLFQAKNSVPAISWYIGRHVRHHEQHSSSTEVVVFGLWHGCSLDRATGIRRRALEDSRRTGAMILHAVRVRSKKCDRSCRKQRRGKYN